MSVTDNPRASDHVEVKWIAPQMELNRDHLTAPKKMVNMNQAFRELFSDTERSRMVRPVFGLCCAKES